MDIRQFLQDCVLVLFLVNIHFGISFGLVEEVDYEDGPATFNRCPWIRNKLKNGRVKYRYRGRFAKFVCDSGYELAGKRSATCVAGQWSNPLPVCVARGCNRMSSIANGRVTVMYRGALLGYDCNPGYALEGPSTIHCDGRRWNTEPPTCSLATDTPDVFCDFESPDLCGWTHDPNHDFDWKRNQFATPSGHAGTGPQFDHSFGEKRGGYYLYIEASTPRKPNDTARIFSPVYFPSQSGGCFLFWYHMYGATTGGLKVYLKPESHVLDELPPFWQKFGDQGNKWIRGNIDVPILHENFQIVIEGIRGESYVGDSAIDDVTLSTNDCLSMENQTETTEKTIADSCRGRCREPDSGTACGCNDDCNTAQNCCIDYVTLCYEAPGNDTAGVNPDEPGDFYGKTTLPATVPATFTTITNVEDKSSSLPSDTTSVSTTEQYVSTSPVASSAAISVTSTTSPITQTTMQIISPSQSSKTVSSTSDSSSIYVTTLSTSTDDAKEIPTTTKQIPISSTTEMTSEKSKELSSTLATSSPATAASTTPTTVSSATTVKSTTTTITTPIPMKSTTTTTTPLTLKTTTTAPLTLKTTTTTRPVENTKSTAITSNTSTTQTTSVTSTMSSTPSTISPPILTTTLSQADKLPSVATSSPTISDTTTFPTRTRSEVTALTPTRKTYNLRPRSSSTTSLSTSTVSSSSTNSNFLTTVKLSLTNCLFNCPSTTTKSEDSTPFRTSWHNFPVAKSSTITSTRSTLKLSTTAPTTKTTSSVTTKTTKKYPTSSQTTKRNQAQKFTFMVDETTSITLQDRINQQDTSKSHTSASKSSVPIAISVLAIVLISIAGGVGYYMKKQRNKRQSKLSDDSEMRFLQENEFNEYSDASALDKILIK